MSNFIGMIQLFGIIITVPSRPVLKKFGSDGSYEIIERLKSRAKVRKRN